MLVKPSFLHKFDQQHSSNYTKFSIVGRVLAKVAQDWATALVIVPCLANSCGSQSVQLVKPGTTPPLLIPAHQHLLQEWTNLQHPIWDFVRHPPTAGHCHLMSSRSLEHHGGSEHTVSIQHSAPSATMAELLYNRWQLNPHQPTVSQFLIDFLNNTLYELGLCHSAIGTHQSAISAI